ncbi:hypothetical protein GIB67_042966 [Kingdonia uniflora]|uniref:peptidylprolyl isomerase n=1 Tax=Kingdonia uniflora TaxID=39325 RepID=A0A7J7L5Z6_9MAGN|nr:hypothetical protein GIB67_042966 [Kingdonia uniflora]
MAVRAPPITGFSYASSLQASSTNRVVSIRTPLKTSLFNRGGSSFAKKTYVNYQFLVKQRVHNSVVRCSSQEHITRSTVCNRNMVDEVDIDKRRNVLGLVFGISSFVATSFNAKGGGLTPEEKPRLCDAACEKNLENVPMVTTESGLQYKDIQLGKGPSPPVGFQVAANYVAMVPSGQIFDRHFIGERSALSFSRWRWPGFDGIAIRVIKGLDEGILSMKVGGKRRLYIPGSLAFPKGLNSAPGRPRVAPSSPVVFDVSLEFVPGLDSEEEEE